MNLGEIARRMHAKEVVQGFLQVERNVERCNLDTLIELLLNGDPKQLEMVGRAINFTLRVKGALDQAGLHGNPVTLRLIDD